MSRSIRPEGPDPRPAKIHLRPTDPRSVTRLAVDATLGIVGMVEQLHRSVIRLAPPIGAAPTQPIGGITGFVYRGVRGVVRAAGGGVDRLLRPVETLLGDGERTAFADSDERTAVVSALNGVIGDRLAAAGDPLAVPMTIRHGGHPLRLARDVLTAAIPMARPRILLLIHGLGMHPGQWRPRGGRDPGLDLAEAHGSTLLHLHYNSGRRVGTNGRELARLLEDLLGAWPVELEAIALVGHSMGGLVARSACHDAMRRGDRWPALLRTMVFLGVPHHGSPLERGGHLVDAVLGASPYTTAFARIGGLRSAGIHDLRHGTILEDDPSGAEPAHVPLPQGVACHAVAGTLARDGQRVRGRLLGDGLVTVDSALGRHPDTGRTLAFDPGRQWTAHGVGHLGLLNDPEVVTRVAGWLQASR